MRLNFSGVNEEEIREGIRRIGKVIAEQVELYGALTGERPAAPQCRGPRPPPESENVVPFRKTGEGRRVKVAVLKGGRSLERGVSLRSAARVEDALERLGHEVVPLDVGGDLVKRLTAERPDVAFVAMHGPGGEDGTAQELLEILGIPFTGPGVAACARCIDKVLAKHELREAGVPTPDWFAFNETAFRELGAADALGRPGGAARLPARGQAEPRRLLARGEVRREPARPCPRPWSRPSATTTGSCSSASSTGASWRSACSAASRCRSSRRSPHAGDRYDFEARYEIGRTSFVCPAELERGRRCGGHRSRARRLRDARLRGLRPGRPDPRRRTGPQVLEVNAIPGLTDTSLLPQAAEAAGMSFERLVERILDLALTPVAA